MSFFRLGSDLLSNYKSMILFISFNKYSKCQKYYVTVTIVMFIILCEDILLANLEQPLRCGKIIEKEN